MCMYIYASTVLNGREGKGREGKGREGEMPSHVDCDWIGRVAKHSAPYDTMISIASTSINPQPLCSFFSSPRRMRKREMKGKYGMVTMCVGTGQGAAGIFEFLN